LKLLNILSAITGRVCTRSEKTTQASNKRILRNSVDIARINAIFKPR